MSDQTLHPDATTELDASVDALVAQMENPAAPQPMPAGVALAEEPLHIPDPPAPSNSASASSQETPPTNPQALLSEISTEIERQNPGPLPTPPAPASTAPAIPPERPLPTDSDIARVAHELEADLGSFEAPTSAELAPEPAPAGATPARTTPAASIATPEPAPPPTSPQEEIRQLDAKLAANAEQVLERAREAAAAAPPAPPAPTAPLTEPSTPPHPPAAKPPDTVPAPTDTVRVVEVPLTDEAPATPAIDLRVALADLLARPLRPIAALHDRLGESNRQTVGYCALVTLFAASCLWGAIPFFRRTTLEPATPAMEFYDANTPAHGVTAPPKEEPKKAAAHGEGGEASQGGHGEKKPSHAKPPKSKPSSSAHGSSGGESHGSEKKTAAAHAKKPAKAAESHGEH